MVCVTIQGTNNNRQAIEKIEDKQKIKDFLAKYNILYEYWGVRCESECGQEAVLQQYRNEIERLKEQGGYVTADVIDVNPETPGLDAMLQKFKREHTHDEDEVRFVVKGSGIFHVHGEDGVVFAVEMHPGDLITVPRGTKHWFNLCSDKTIQTIRLFQDPSGWAPYYVDEEIHKQYEPVCFGPSYIGKSNGVRRVVEP